jgi:hypothetical protein
MDASKLYSELQSAGKNKEKLGEVAEKVITKAFESELVEIDYRTENPELNVGEPTVAPQKFMLDGVRVQNVGMGAGERLNIKASYYDTAAKTETILSLGADLTAGSPNNGRTITVNTNIIVTLSPETMQGEGMVMFTEGYT